jgi:hypothetical protein
MTCRVWSARDGVYFTGLCSMVLIPETANPTNICELCVIPIEVEPEPDPDAEPDPEPEPEP